MSIGTIGKTPIYITASRLEHWANQNGQNTLTKIKSGRYTIRTDRNDGTYVKTVLESNNNGIVERGYSRLYKGTEKLKEKLKSLCK